MKHWRLALVFILALGLAGCSLGKQPYGAEASAEGGSASAQSQPTGRYYDFDDIQVPSQLKLNKERSILFKVGAFKAGVLVLEDNLEGESLINFFMDSMAKDNWVLKSSFKYPQVALFFAKKGKTCVINIKERTFSTEVAIWVAPAL
jgi:hypothetical protein